MLGPAARRGKTKTTTPKTRIEVRSTKESHAIRANVIAPAKDCAMAKHQTKPKSPLTKLLGKKRNLRTYSCSDTTSRAQMMPKGEAPLYRNKTSSTPQYTTPMTTLCISPTKSRKKIGFAQGPSDRTSISAPKGIPPSLKCWVHHSPWGSTQIRPQCQPCYKSSLDPWS